VRNGATGSHLGFTGELHVGGMNVPSGNNPMSDKGGHGKSTAGANGNLQSPSAILGSSYADGSISYRELRETDNPYDARFNVGTVTVGAVEAVGENDSDKKQNAAPPEADKP